MYKKILLMTMFCGLPTLANGVFGFNQDLLKSNGPVELTPTLNLYIHETLSEENRLFYKSWTCLKANQWIISDHILMKGINKQFSLGIGPSYYRESYTNTFSLKIYSEIKLW